MDERTLQVLEFDKVLAMLAARVHFGPAEELALALRPATDAATAARRLAEAAEARGILERDGQVPIGDLADIRRAVRVASRGAVLPPEDLLAVAGIARAARRLRSFLEERAARAPLLAGLAAGLPDLSLLAAEIDRCIADDGQVVDAASAALASARRALRAAQARVRERLEALVRAPEMQSVLQEPIVTVRGDRFVVPVRVEQRSRLPGVVHDQSGSGATLFVEPLAVVELNNEVRRLAMREAEEVERVLAALSRRVAGAAAALDEAVAILAQLDLAFARGELGLEMEGEVPELNEDGVVELRRARHPLLTVPPVPIDLRLGLDFDTLVITGPNTGGKTVSLKTLGLLTLMAQAGLLVPAAAGSRMAVFRQVFADIGDEQSIEQSLSTFSSHMTHIVHIVRTAEPGALILLDELGAGTDPDEGAALAMALLSHFQARGMRTVATTHYSELKTFAYERSRVENASVEFDAETLAPTYRLVIGVPGRSNAFAIAARLGLPDAILEEARRLLGRPQRDVAAAIADLARQEAALEEERRRAAAAREAAEAARAAYEERLAALRQREGTVLEEARREARDLVRRAKAECDALLRQAREAAQAGALPQAERVRQRLNQLRRELEAPAEEPPSGGKAPQGLEAGDAVLVRSLGQRGHVLTPPGPDGRVVVQVGALRVEVPAVDLARVEETRSPAGGRPRGRAEGTVAGDGAGPPAAGGWQQLGLQRSRLVSPEIHLRGLTVAEALERLEKYLDDAVLAGLDEVRIVHGKGTGALRQAVAQWLQQHPRVAEFRLGGPGEGGDGATVARLR
ncbi:MAG: endonuclease MutS2 [Clostridia bacterium]|nr:endonuclease MutS2 [Clostridia bacterium]